MRLFALLILALALALPARGAEAEPFLKPNDVIALIGGEDMVVANELGYLETLLQRNLPDYHLKIRSLAWEGDTVFEQHRDLNYPTLETQLDKIGATVIICQFGQMESLSGKAKLPEFVAAYEALLKRLSKPGAPSQMARRIAIAEPFLIAQEDGPDFSASGAAALQQEKQANLIAYATAIDEMADRLGARLVRCRRIPTVDSVIQRRDGFHLTTEAHFYWANQMAAGLLLPTTGGAREHRDAKMLASKVAEKNRLWFEYTRPQNWAFLAGDRTNQPSSRDHLDKNKRWFPEEMEKFVPLIDQKDQEIWAAAEKLTSK